MSRPTIALGLPHTPWVPERVESYRRLRRALHLDEAPKPEQVTYLRPFTDRAPNHVWSLEMWRWAASTDATHFLTLQDDAEVAPDFWRQLEAMIEERPHDVIGLEAAHQAGPLLARQGHRWYTTADMLIGVGYVLPRHLLTDFLAWRESSLTDDAKGGALTEDTSIAVWCAVSGRKIYHPIPTILDHDTSIASTYANDAHSNRRPTVTWRGRNLPSSWVQGVVPHLGRFYDATPALADKYVLNASPGDLKRMRLDTGQNAMRRLVMWHRAHQEPVARVSILTPNRGALHPEHARTIQRIAYDSAVELVDLETQSVHYASEDVVRVRSRLLRQFLDTDATHAWFLDGDVSADPTVLSGMWQTKKDIVLCPYPRRDEIRFEELAKPDQWNRPPQARVYRYPMTLLPGSNAIDVNNLEPDGTAEILGGGLGCALVSRNAVERMTAHYDEDLHFFDTRCNGVRTVALFLLPITPERALPSEDVAFCLRWRAMGEKVWLYLGPGSPATHHGEHAYRGDVRAFGIQRIES